VDLPSAVIFMKILILLELLEVCIFNFPMLDVTIGLSVAVTEFIINSYSA
jgi:hypothetical protein